MKKSKSKHQNLEECNDTSDKKRIISIKKKEKKMLKMDNAKEDIQNEYENVRDIIILEENLCDVEFMNSSSSSQNLVLRNNLSLQIDQTKKYDIQKENTSNNSSVKLNPQKEYSQAHKNTIEPFEDYGFSDFQGIKTSSKNKIKPSKHIESLLKTYTDPVDSTLKDNIENKSKLDFSSNKENRSKPDSIYSRPSDIMSQKQIQKIKKNMLRVSSRSSSPNSNNKPYQPTTEKISVRSSMIYSDCFTDSKNRGINVKRYCNSNSSNNSITNIEVLNCKNLDKKIGILLEDFPKRQYNSRNSENKIEIDNFDYEGKIEVKNLISQCMIEKNDSKDIESYKENISVSSHQISQKFNNSVEISKNNLINSPIKHRAIYIRSRNNSNHKENMGADNLISTRPIDINMITRQDDQLQNQDELVLQTKNPSCQNYNFQEQMNKPYGKNNFLQESNNANCINYGHADRKLENQMGHSKKIQNNYMKTNENIVELVRKNENAFQNPGQVKYDYCDENFVGLVEPVPEWKKSRDNSQGIKVVGLSGVKELPFESQIDGDQLEEHEFLLKQMISIGK